MKIKFIKVLRTESFADLLCFIYFYTFREKNKISETSSSRYFTSETRRWTLQKIYLMKTHQPIIIIIIIINIIYEEN